MPGRHRQNGEGCVEQKLTRQQAALAGRVLKSLWNPEPSGTPPTDEEKARIHAEIRSAFLQAGHTPCYSLRKLGDAISNRMYAYRLAQRNKVRASRAVACSRSLCRCTPLALSSWPLVVGRSRTPGQPGHALPAGSATGSPDQ